MTTDPYMSNTTANGPIRELIGRVTIGHTVVVVMRVDPLLAITWSSGDTAT